ncbi:hypothetical protein [Consotaella salsifontis]|uniref:Uncharacterized protein n=1 Tax=Consotaella salsifontis TaxID=1365950 RepID=A0A1T4NVZ8_9HYPH|nr:hypothetical protein [Consotaella salsifontis]SJZ83236.1 hypothetical protein SAMN05428963_103211 [Consotaella salsifontis]
MAENRPMPAIPAPSHRLADAVRAAKIAAAQRSDVVIDIREADRARLEILSEELQPLLEDLPADDDFFDFALSGGPQPRLWIDATANVIMARDRRTYRFVRETRLGRLTLAEAQEPRVIADRITDYVAERIIEREKAFALNDGVGERIAERARQPRAAAADPIRVGPPARPRSTDFVIAFTWMIIGIVIGVAALYAFAAWQGLLPPR